MSARAHVSSVGTGPQVVVGITAPRSEDSSALETRGEPRAESAESRETRGVEAALPSQAMPKLVLAEPSLELVREAERLELVREESLEEEARRDELPPGDAQPDATETSAGSASLEAFTVLERDSQPAELTPAPHRAALLTPDEMSIPPAGDLSVEPIADRFFSEGELATVHGASDEEEWDEVANEAKRKSRPEVVQRRAHLAKYVRWAVGGAAVVCLAALARTTIAPSRSPSAAAPVAAVAPVSAVEAPAAKAATPTVITPAVAAPAPVAEPAQPAEAVAVAAPAEAKPEAAKAEAVKPEAPAAEAAPEPAKSAPPVATSDKTALQEKNDARRSLERGKLADAIEAGERSVALDPTDGEAWLLLGAAYQEKGKNADARRCYASCLKEGKRGPLGECRAMIR
jgi:hypothetical protein